MANKIAIVTGCSSGIGRATALELTARGYAVVATARRPESMRTAVDRTLSLDVDPDESVASARDAVGPVDILVNNAGFGIEGPVEEVPLAEVRRAFETNFFGAARMIQAFVPAMREPGFRPVVNVTSVSGIVGGPLAGFYSRPSSPLEALSDRCTSRSAISACGCSWSSRARLRHVSGTTWSIFAADQGRTRSWPSCGRRPWVFLAARGSGTGTRACGDQDLRCARRRAPSTPTARRRRRRTDAASRQGIDFDDFEAAMRGILQLDWS